ncbi:MAG: helix-turn-helix transcriptional regulator [Oscillospiraceae bacterium]|nr:helix-turn-helix transcriptional regulator [Oscillospiraceae bacterium]
MLDKTKTGEKIREARKKLGWTQEQFAKKIPVEKQAVSNWERGANLPDEGIRDKIEEILQTKLPYEKKNTFCGNTLSKTIPELKPLEEINSIDDITDSVNKIIDSVKIDEYKTVLRKMLFLTLMELLGYEIYYEMHCRKYYSKDKSLDNTLNWALTALNIRDIVKIHNDWPLNETKYKFQSSSLFAKKVEWMAYLISGELFEDFDENGYRNSFVQEIGQYGEVCGYELLDLIPDSNSDIMVIYKSAMLDIAEILLQLKFDA